MWLSIIFVVTYVSVSVSSADPASEEEARVLQETPLQRFKRQMADNRQQLVALTSKVVRRDTAQPSKVVKRDTAQQVDEVERSGSSSLVGYGTRRGGGTSSYSSPIDYAEIAYNGVSSGLGNSNRYNRRGQGNGYGGSFYGGYGTNRGYGNANRGNSYGHGQVSGYGSYGGGYGSNQGYGNQGGYGSNQGYGNQGGYGSNQGYGYRGNSYGNRGYSSNGYGNAQYNGPAGYGYPGQSSGNTGFVDVGANYYYNKKKSQ